MYTVYMLDRVELIPSNQRSVVLFINRFTLKEITMIKRFIAVIVLCAMFTGCALSPQQERNIVNGAAVGAVIGGVFGGLTPVHQQQRGYGIPPGAGLPPGYACHPGSQWDGRGCRNLYPQHYQQRSGGLVPAGSCPANRFPAGCRLVNGQWMGVPVY